MSSVKLQCLPREIRFLATVFAQWRQCEEIPQARSHATKSSRLDLRAQFVVKGFLQGLHASPFHGFSVEFSEHRKYTVWG